MSEISQECTMILLESGVFGSFLPACYQTGFGKRCILVRRPCKYEASQIPVLFSLGSFFRKVCQVAYSPVLAAFDRYTRFDQLVCPSDAYKFPVRAIFNLAQRDLANHGN
jgi:hypothetical protein